MRAQDARSVTLITDESVKSFTRAVSILNEVHTVNGSDEHVRLSHQEMQFAASGRV